MHIPVDGGWLGNGGIAYAKGTSRDGLGVIHLEVGNGGRGGLPNEEGNTSFSGVFREGSEDIKGVGNSAKGENEGVMGAVYFL